MTLPRRTAEETVVCIYSSDTGPAAHRRERRLSQVD